MAYHVRLATRITDPVNVRLRMLALVNGHSLSHTLVVLLDKTLPPADELAALLAGRRIADAQATSPLDRIPDEAAVT